MLYTVNNQVSRCQAIEKEQPLKGGIHTLTINKNKRSSAVNQICDNKITSVE